MCLEKVEIFHLFLFLVKDLFHKRVKLLFAVRTTCVVEVLFHANFVLIHLNKVSLFVSMENCIDYVFCQTVKLLLRF